MIPRCNLCKSIFTWKADKKYKVFCIADAHWSCDGPYLPSCTPTQRCSLPKKNQSFPMSLEIPNFGRRRKMSYKKFQKTKAKTEQLLVLFEYKTFRSRKIGLNKVKPQLP